ncbi:hypothetical protein [Streptomyces scabiei]|uniref:hypothetical protein n=1 Tax=Streptomyces scabiei TaxID=1930 RepID=UPI001B340B70|nr:hypothetical protein [Streptomyces sp. LBUM 1481]
MNVYEEWSNTTTSAAMPRNASGQSSRDGPDGEKVPSNRLIAEGDGVGAALSRGGSAWVSSNLFGRAGPGQGVVITEFSG